MNKEYISYGIIGVIAGLVFGFLVANWTSTGSAGTSQGATSNTTPQASVNSSSQSQELPPGHPPVDPSAPAQAGPLPAGAEEAARKSSTPAAGAGEEFQELPSLDPLPAASREKRAEQEYKNIQLLRGIPAERLTKVMFAFKSSLGVDCTHCHVKDQWEKDDKPAKQTARKMITMMRDANSKLGGSARVTCYTCHRGQARPPE